MANLQTVAKAEAVKLAMQQIFGLPPTVEYGETAAKIYYQPDKLQQVQQRIDTMSRSSPGDVQVQWLPMVTPLAIKRALPFVVGIFVAGYLLGKRK